MVQLQCDYHNARTANNSNNDNINDNNNIIIIMAIIIIRNKLKIINNNNNNYNFRYTLITTVITMMHLCHYGCLYILSSFIYTSIYIYYIYI